MSDHNLPTPKSGIPPPPLPTFFVPKSMNLISPLVGVVFPVFALSWRWKLPFRPFHSWRGRLRQNEKVSSCSNGLTFHRHALAHRSQPRLPLSFGLHHLAAAYQTGNSHSLPGDGYFRSAGNADVGLLGCGFFRGFLLGGFLESFFLGRHGSPPSGQRLLRYTNPVHKHCLHSHLNRGVAIPLKLDFRFPLVKKKHLLAPQKRAGTI